MTTTTKAEVLAFITYAIDKGLVNSNTGGGWRSATSKILEDFGDDDDVSEVDVPSEVLRYHNRHPGQLSPDSLNQYQKRVITVLAECAKYTNNPQTYKGVLRGPTGLKSDAGAKKDGKKAAVKQLPAPESTATPTHEPQNRLPAATETSLMVPFALRSNFVVQFVIPRDLTSAEAKRLCNVITAYGHDEQVVDQ